MFFIFSPPAFFKNTNPQSDTKTFGQLVAKLNKDKGCKTRTTRTPACNTGLAAMAGDVVNSTFVHLINFSAWGQVSASKPPLRQARNRCCEIRFAPFAASARRLPPPDALVRYADFAHQAVLRNASASEAFGFKLRHCAKPPGR